MVKFRPTVYEEGDFRSYKYIGSADITEGTYCKVSSTISHSYQGVVKFTGNPVSVTGTNVTTGSVLKWAYDQTRYFPVKKSEPDPEDVTPTISQNDYVIGFFGKEYEVHSDLSACLITTYTVGGRVALASTGLITAAGATYDTGLQIGECVGTFNSTWIRVRI